MSPPPLRFYFDFISPYAYVGWSLGRRIADEHGREMVAVPVLFAAILDAHGQKGPAEIPAKRVYTFKDAYRKSIASGVGPIVPPPSHPFNPLVALRVAGLPMEEARRSRLVTAIFESTWKTGAGCEGNEAVERIASQIGEDGADLIRRAGETAAKDLLKTTTADAIARGVFGVPTVDAGSELFWGVDGIGFLGAFLDGNDPLEQGGLERWASLGASASRRMR